MYKGDLIDLISHGENSHVEFKRDTRECPEGLAQEIVALANFRGGKILIGVEDDHTVSGIQEPRLKEWVMESVCDPYVYPPITPQYNEIQVNENQRVAMLTIDQGIHKPYVVRHEDSEQAYIRVGTTSRIARREEQACLLQIGGIIHPELMPVQSSGLSDLCPHRLRHYLVSIMNYENTLSGEETRSVLSDLGMLTGSERNSERCTIAGILLFGNTPRRLLRCAGIRCIVHERDEKDEAIFDQRFDGPLMPRHYTSADDCEEVLEKGLIDIVIDAIRSFVSVKETSIEDSSQGALKWQYPVEAIREALTNAVAHRDWTRLGEIEVSIYADRIEILSPGALVDSMTVSKILSGRRSVRNQLISRALRDYGYIKSRGIGVRMKIVPLLKEHNGNEPRIISTEEGHKVVMYKRGHSAQDYQKLQPQNALQP